MGRSGLPILASINAPHQQKHQCVVCGRADGEGDQGDYKDAGHGIPLGL